MKKHLLIILAIFITAFANGQAVVSILAPSDFAGIYDFTRTSDNDLPWGTPDLEDPANAIFGILAVGRDGTVEDSLGCEELINGDEIAGKIALIYRNVCFFDQKCLHAQNAGAIGVIIVNRLGAEPINMTSPLDGTGVGDQVTIPVVMVQGEEVLNWRPEVDAGILEAFIGNKNGLFDNDLGMTPPGVLRAQHFSHPTALSQNGDYIVPMGADIINYGSETQSNVSLSAVISLNESVLYNETSSTVLAMANGDTVSFDLPSFSPDNFAAGFYKVTYAVVYGVEDQFPTDNLIEANFMISDSLFSYSRIVPETGLPNNRSFYLADDNIESMHSCVEFLDPNAGSMLLYAKGLSFSASIDNDLDMTGVTVDAYIYEWANDFEDVDDPNFDPDMQSLEELTFGSFEYLNNDLENKNIYIPFEDGPFLLEDDVRYLFCINHFTNFLRTGYDSRSMDYTRNIDFYKQPMFPLEANETWFWRAFGEDAVPAITVNIDFLTAINEEIQRVDITPFPNPVRNEINIPIGNFFGKTRLDVYDIAGKKVKSLNITTSSNEILKVDMSDMDNGAYIFKMNFEDGSFSNFSVIVNQ